MSQNHFAFTISLWTIIHIPVVCELIYTGYIYYLKPSKLTAELLFICMYQLFMRMVINPYDFNKTNFWFIFFSQLYHVIFGFIFIIYNLIIIEDLINNPIFLVHVIFSFIYLLWITMCVNLIYMEYTLNRNLDQVYTFNLFSKCFKCSINNTVLPKFNKITPINFIKLNTIYIRSYLDPNNTDCPICYEKCLEESITCNQCGNKVCKNCKLQLEKLECPVCRNIYC